MSKEFKVLVLNFKNMPSKELLKTIEPVDWLYADEFQAPSALIAAEVVAEEHSSMEDETILVAVKEKGKKAVVIEVDITMVPETNAQPYRFKRGKK